MVGLAARSVGRAPQVGRLEEHVPPRILVAGRALADVLRLAGEAIPGSRVIENKYSTRDRMCPHD